MSHFDEVKNYSSGKEILDEHVYIGEKKAIRQYFFKVFLTAAWPGLF